MWSRLGRSGSPLRKDAARRRRREAHSEKNHDSRTGRRRKRGLDGIHRRGRGRIGSREDWNVGTLDYLPIGGDPRGTRVKEQPRCQRNTRSE